MGRPGSSSCSLPKAIKEPQNETEPTIVANSAGTLTCNGSSRNPFDSRNSTQAINATAPPPTPLNSATICGMAVIRTCRAAGTPMAVPTTRPRRTKDQFSKFGVSNVAMMAMAMPAAAIAFPRTAVRGPVIRISP